MEENVKKTCKLWFHQKDGRLKDVDFLYSCKDFPSLRLGDVIEIYHGDEAFSHLLVQVKPVAEDLLTKQRSNTVSVDEALASVFHLKNYGDVTVTKVDPEDVALDMLELSFKEQYVSSSDYFRLRKVLLETCVHLNKKIEYCGIRMLVQEMYKGGERIACGYVNSSTRVVFRSNSALVYIMIQMSVEMWEFDKQGDLYAEKCLAGFLPDLFKKWKERSCSHFVSIVLFSRWFCNDADGEQRSPVKSRLLENSKGQRYRDFYHLIVHNEQYEEWQPVLSKLKAAFANYCQTISQYAKRFNMVNAKNSPATNGNFLETLNIPLNFFTKHYLNRSFERTGQLAIVISPGTGVYYVEKELALLTKQRSIDCGTAVDLVCLGEQPFHVVPLFCSLENSDIFTVPHWMNTSYYNPVKHTAIISRFKSRVRITESVLDAPECVQLNPPEMDYGSVFENDVPAFDLYDEFLFGNFTSSVGVTTSLVKSEKGTPTESPSMTRRFRRRDCSVDFAATGRSNRRKLSNRSAGPISFNIVEDTMCGSMESQNALSLEPTSSDCAHRFDERLDGVDSDQIDPFSPAGHSVPITSERRRWIHVFPVDPLGLSRQPHHFYRGSSVIRLPPLVEEFSENVMSNELAKVSSMQSQMSDGLGKNFVWAWGPTGEECWSHEIEVTVDWKSLTLPACLPITTDYFPDLETLRNDYYVSEHSIFLDEAIREAWQPSNDFRSDIFNELICQRLQRDFQIVQADTELLQSAKATILSNVGSPERECFMGDNITYHRLALIGQTVYVSKFLPRVNVQFSDIQYNYMLQGPDFPVYSACATVFRSDQRVGMNWSFLDNMVVMRGEGEDFRLTDELECLECRFMLAPFDPEANRQVLENNDDPLCDLYKFGPDHASEDERRGQITKFVKFMEIFNRMRRAQLVQTEAKKSPTVRLSIDHQSALLDAAASSLAIACSHLQLPAKTMVSASLVHWLVDNVAELSDVGVAMGYCQKMLNAGQIRAVNQDRRQDAFAYGFVLYHVSTGGRDKACADFSSVVEIEIDFPYCADHYGSQPCSVDLRSFWIDFDPVRRSDRREWGQLRLSQRYRVEYAFEIHLRWVVATGSLVGDMLYNWWRKSIALGLNLIPVPIDPFVMPENPDSDPFRNPIFVPFDQAVVDAVTNESNRLRLCYLILYHFGFLPINCYVHREKHEFVHSSGGMLAMIAQDKNGYLWTWNPMVGRRYRSQLVTGDAQFQDKILNDLQLFCADHCQRLRLFIQKNIKAHF